MRVVLIGGTSHTGKSTLARGLAERLGWNVLSTDALARHPGRPWQTAPENAERVAAHYRELSPEATAAAQREHYERLWPTVEQRISGADGLVLEGTGIWPDRVAGLDPSRVAAFWLTADATTLRDRIHASSGFAGRTAEQQFVITRFVARTVLVDELLKAELRRHHLTGIDIGRMPIRNDLVERIVRSLQAD